MHIALIHYRIMLRGGLETRLVNYTHHLIELGHQVTIICAKNKGKLTFPDSVEIVQLKSPFVPKVFRMLAFNNRLKHYLAKHNFDFSLSLGRTYHQDAVLAPSNHQGYLDAMGMSGKRVTDWVQNYLDRKVGEKSKIIYAASSMMKEEMMRYYGAKEEQLHLLFPPLNTDNFHRISAAERQALRQQHDISPSTKVFAFVSASHFRKGMDILMDAFEILQEEDVLLLIAGHPKVKINLPNVRYLGFLDSPKLIYHLADFTLHPARYEPFGQIVSESLACDTPIFVSDWVGAKEIIAPNVGRVLKSLAPKDWAALIQAAKRSDYSIPEDFVAQHRLSLAQHVERMLEIAK